MTSKAALTPEALAERQSILELVASAVDHIDHPIGGQLLHAIENGLNLSELAAKHDGPWGITLRHRADKAVAR